MRDGVIDVDVATPAARGFFGIQFRIASDGASGEWAYLRQQSRRLPTRCSTRRCSTPGSTGSSTTAPALPARSTSRRSAGSTCASRSQERRRSSSSRTWTFPRSSWTTWRSGNETGQVALAVLTGATYFANFELRPTEAAAWVRHEPPMPRGTLTKWSLSPAYDALHRSVKAAVAEGARRDSVAGGGGGGSGPRGHQPVSREPASESRRSRATPEAPRTAPGMRSSTRADDRRGRDEVRQLATATGRGAYFDPRDSLSRPRAQNFRDPAFPGSSSPETERALPPVGEGPNCPCSPSSSSAARGVSSASGRVEVTGGKRVWPRICTLEGARAQMRDLPPIFARWCHRGKRRRPLHEVAGHFTPLRSCCT